jgi:hypothetical protein
MMRTIGILLFLVAGCGDEPERLPAHLTDHVQVGKAEPGPRCQSLGALEGMSTDGAPSRYESAYGAIKDTAAIRGGNYVVIDQVSSFVEGSDAQVVIRGRVYACTLGLPPPMVAAECH